LTTVSTIKNNQAARRQPQDKNAYLGAHKSRSAGGALRTRHGSDRADRSDGRQAH
jgi:hypothetical protein